MIELKNHMFFVHIGMKLNNCQLCTKSFKHKVSLETHVHRNHSDEIPERYACDLCAKSYLHKQDLKFHQSTIHYNEEKFRHQCKLCGKAFSHIRLLNRHFKTSHEGLRSE